MKGFLGNGCDFSWYKNLTSSSYDYLHAFFLDLGSCCGAVGVTVQQLKASFKSFEFLFMNST